jgi:hypothetical protein
MFVNADTPGELVTGRVSLEICGNVAGTVLELTVRLLRARWNEAGSDTRTGTDPDETAAWRCMVAHHGPAVPCCPD